MRRAHAFLRSDGPIAFAHRGGAALAPENTLAAFDGAVALGVRWIETDVHLSRDGVVVVHHDATLDRTTDGAGPLRARSLDELRRLDAGYRFSVDDGRTFPERGRGHGIPTFAEVLERHPTIRFNVELKQREPAMVEAFWRLVQQHDAQERVLIAAEDERIGAEVRAVTRGRVPTSPGVRGVLGFWAAARAGAARWVPFPWDALQVPHRHGPLTVVDRRFVAAAHERGVHVHVWTIDDISEMHELLDLGVDGVMTDRPDRLLAVLAARARPGP
ncbi:MAG: glycerophosphodiester phosphodiesterase [Polyangiaceae bacterium]|nr:glycerophosphodiester phosphodiesterase [Polyangiaceae bacterium]